MRQLSAVLAIAAVLAGAAALAAPRPADVPRHWQIDATFKDLLPIRIKLAGETAPRTFWYLRYEVTNNTGQDRVFVPELILYTDTGQVLRAGRNIPSAVFQAIKELHGDPLMLDAAAVAGKLLQGEENAKGGVAIWNDFDAEAASFDVFVSGLSGETMEIKLPRPVRAVETDRWGKRVEVIKDSILLAKSLRRHYVVPGEPATRAVTGVQFIKQDWVMR